MSRLLLGVSGGVAAYKAIETARLAVKAGHSVRVLETEAAKRFVGPASFEAITGAPVLCDEFEPDPLRGAYPGEPEPPRTAISHLALVQRADAYLIAPASANTIAKLANGLTDNLLTAAALAASCPVLVAPAMNNRMYEHPATQANLARLRERGTIVIDPGEGELASYGEHGVGRLAEPAALVEAWTAAAAAGTGADGARGGTHVASAGTGLADGEPAARPWDGLRVLVTAGGTREPIDSVRFIGNRSSGRMGWALAARAVRRGAEVTLVAANVTLPEPPGVRTLIEVETAAEMHAACVRELERSDVLLMAAAVADFRPRAAHGGKLKKEQGVPRLEVEPTIDILSDLAARRQPGQVVVGFAAEHGADAVANARRKLERKRLDAVVVNDISRPGIGFDSPENEVTIVLPGSERPVPRADKERVADTVLDQVQELLATKEPHDRAVRTDAPGAARV